MVMDPRQAAQVKLVAGVGDSNVGEPRFCFLNRARDGPPVVVFLVGVARRGEVIGDLDARPFAALGFMGGGHRDLGVVLVLEAVDSVEDGVGSVGVDEVHEGLEVSSCRIVGRVVLEVAPGRKEEQFRVGCGSASPEGFCKRERVLAGPPLLLSGLRGGRCRGVA